MEGLVRDRERERTLKNMLERLKKEEFKKQYAREKEAERVWRRGEIMGAHLWCYHFVPRTMEVAKKYIENCYFLRQTPYSGTVFIAQTVNQAQGRYNRKWYALPGGLWFSFILYPEVELPYIHLYPLVLGIACCEALREIGINVYIKWVNDLVFNRHKWEEFWVKHTFLPRKKHILFLALVLMLITLFHPHWTYLLFL